MGRMHREAGAIDLVLSLAHEPEDHQIREWIESVEHASRALFGATHGVAFIRRLVVATGGRATQEADVLVYPSTASAPTAAAQLMSGGVRALSVLMSDKRVLNPMSLTHELGHYAFGLEDEYWKDSYSCHRTDSHPGCVMEGSGHSYRLERQCPPSPTEPLLSIVRDGFQPRYFCDRNTHSCQNPQHDRYGKSCWEHLQTLDGIHLPDEQPEPDDMDWSAFVPPEATRLGTHQRFTLVLDTSSAAARDQLPTFLAAAEVWVDALAGSGHSLALVVGPGQAESLYLTRYVRRWNKKLKAWIRRNHRDGWWHPQDDPSAAAMEQALRRGLDALPELAKWEAKRRYWQAERRPEPATQAILLLSEGQPDSEEALEDGIQCALRERVTIDVIAPTSMREAQAALLGSVCQRTLGRFFRALPRHSGTHDHQLVETYILALAEMVEDLGAVAVETNHTQFIPWTAGAAPANVPNPRDERLEIGPRRLESLFEFDIEEGAHRAYAFLSGPRGADLNIELIDPMGRPRRSGRLAFRMAGPGHILLHVRRPPVGQWKARVFSRNQPTSAVRFGLTVLCKNPDVITSVRGSEKVHAVGTDVALEANAFHPDFGPPPGPGGGTDNGHEESHTQAVAFGPSDRPPTPLTPVVAPLPRPPIGTAGDLTKLLAIIYFKTKLAPFEQAGSWPIRVEVVIPGKFKRIRQFQLHVLPATALPEPPRDALRGDTCDEKDKDEKRTKSER